MITVAYQFHRYATTTTKPLPIFFHSYNHLLNVINTIRLNVFFSFSTFFLWLARRLTTHKTRSIIYIAFASGKRLSSRNAVMANHLEMMNFWVIFCQIWFCFFFILSQPFCKVYRKFRRVNSKNREFENGQMEMQM